MQEKGGQVITPAPTFKACNDCESKTSGIASTSGMLAILIVETPENNTNTNNVITNLYL